MLCKGAECCGCGSCFQICSNNCIVMKTDSEGFRYPVIDANKCVECKLCEQVCPILNPVDKSEKSEAYAAINLNDNLRERSSSGGVFAALANAVLQQNGYVCGVVYDEDFVIMHKISNIEDEILEMCGAKYAQSNAWECFKEIKEKLEVETIVLFVGTPCQVAGLKRFLIKNYKTLITVDMICHGVPSPMIWKQYIKERNSIDTLDSILNKVELRNKESGWSRYRYSVKFSYKNGDSYCAEQQNDKYMIGFVNNLFLRPSCAKCQFKGIERCSDITLGDYWGIWDQKPEFDDDKGTSLIFIHTQNGKQLWDRVGLNFKMIQVNVDEAVQQNPSALKSSIPHENRNKFFAEYNCEESLIKHIEKQLGISEQKKQSIFNRVAKKIFVWRQ